VSKEEEFNAKRLVRLAKERCVEKWEKQEYFASKRRE